MHQLQDIVSPGQTEKDKIYNTVARDEPAYISLLFPIAIILIFNFKYDFINSCNPVTYIFNSIICLGLLLPALFFLYKQIIRSVSVLIVEKFIFKIFHPEHAYFLNNIPGHISELNLVRLSNYISPEIALKEKINERRFIWCKKSLRDSIKSTIAEVRYFPACIENSIIFENNCIYGFFRNLVGGIALNLLIIYMLSIFGVLEKLNDVFPSVKELIGNIFYIGKRVLWTMLALCSILAWQARYRHCSKMIEIYISKKSQN